MENIVLDASVVIKWFKKTGEEKGLEAEKILKDFLDKKIKISVPALVFYELVNIASYDKTISEKNWEDILELVFSLPWEVYPLDRFLIKETYSLAKNFRLSAYDAAYLSLAKRLKTVVLTSDRDLIRKGENLVRSL